MRYVGMALAAASLALGSAQARADDGPFTTDFVSTIEAITETFHTLTASHAATMEQHVLGSTPEGRELAIYTIGNRVAKDRVLLLCNHHGDEQWVAQLCVDFTRYL